MNMNKKSDLFRITYIYLVLLIIIRLIPFIYPTSRTWGFNHLIFLPDIYTYAFFIIGAVALILPLLKFSESIGEKVSVGFSDLFLDSGGRYLYRLIFIAIMTVIFAFNTAPTHFLGDGYDVIQNIASQTDMHLKWSEIGSTKLMMALSYLFGDRNLESSRDAFQLISIAAGAVAIYLLFLIASVSSDNLYKRFIIFVTCLLSGSLLLFFGYAEFYPLVWPFMTGFIYFGLAYLKNGKGLIPAILFLLIGLFLHVEMILFLPAGLYLLLARGRGRNIYNKYKTVIRTLLGIAAALFLIFLTYKYRTDLYIEDMFLPLIDGKPVDPGYAILSLPHLLDLFNEMILISPPIFLLLLFSFGRFKSGLAKPAVRFIGITAAFSLLFLLVIDPKLAMPRDWDLFAFVPLLITLTLLLIISGKKFEYLSRQVVSIVLILVISAAPFLLTNLDRDRSEEYIEYIIDLDRGKSLSSLIVLMNYQLDRGNQAELDSLGNIYANEYRYDDIFDDALEAAVNGDLDKAVSLGQMIKPNRFDGDYQRYLATVNMLMGQYDKALEHINYAIQLRYFYGEYHWTKSRILYAANRYKESLASLRDLHKLEPANVHALDATAMIYDKIGQPDSCLVYSHKMMEQDSTRYNAYKYLVKSWRQKKQIDSAQYYLQKYRNIAGIDSTLLGNLTELENLIK